MTISANQFSLLIREIRGSLCCREANNSVTAATDKLKFHHVFRSFRACLAAPSLEAHLLDRIDFDTCLELQRRLLPVVAARDDGQVGCCYASTMRSSRSAGAARRGTCRPRARCCVPGRSRRRGSIAAAAACCTARANWPSTRWCRLLASLEGRRDARPAVDGRGRNARRVEHPRGHPAECARRAVGPQRATGGHRHRRAPRRNALRAVAERQSADRP